MAAESSTGRGAMPKTLIILAAALLSASVAAGDSLAAKSASKVGASPPVVESLLDCRKVVGDAERLACYDKAVAAVAQATATGDLVAIDREQRRKARRQAFGFTLPSLAFLERGERVEEANHLAATAEDAGRNALGEWVITLDDGAVWVQVEASELGRKPHKGSKVVISKGVLGAFFMTIDGEGAGKVKRQS
jgi:hypothetical protein